MGGGVDTGHMVQPGHPEAEGQDCGLGALVSPSVSWHCDVCPGELLVPWASAPRRGRDLGLGPWFQGAWGTHGSSRGSAR